MRSGPIRAGALALLACCVVSPTARAQLGASTQTGNNLSVEHLTPQPHGFVSLDRTTSQRWREWSAGLYVHYVNSPLVLFRSRLQVGEVVNHRVSTDFVGSIGIAKWLEVGLAVPVTWWQAGDPMLPTGNLASIGFRDLRLRPKFTIGTQDQTGFVGVAIVPGLTIPIGGDASFLGDGGFTFRPEALIDRSFDVLFGLRFGVGLGANIRPEARVGNIEVSHEMFYKVGAGVGLPNLFDLHPEAVAELHGMTQLTEPFQNREQNPLIARLGLRTAIDLRPGHRILAQGGVSFGATRGYGSPDMQVYAGLVYSRYMSDRDGDGILDDDDACPDDPEDKDGFDDLDGCPDPDNDKDGIPDVADECPMEAEDIDKFEDLDGCPDPDNDKDTILDEDDQCPLDPEDMDGFEDEDGCPDPDNDRDGIPDSEDKCATEKETINGVDDEDGCPDDGDINVEVTSEKVTINQKVMFDFDSARIKEESHSILNQVALTLKANPQLERIRVEGHTDSRGSDTYNLELSQKRSESVLTYLVGRGVESKRLEAVGYGELKPILEEETEKAWALNRRVEFTILDQQGGAGALEMPVDMKIEQPAESGAKSEADSGAKSGADSKAKSAADSGANSAAESEAGSENPEPEVEVEVEGSGDDLPEGDAPPIDGD